jgi:hypothetical protein
MLHHSLNGRRGDIETLPRTMIRDNVCRHELLSPAAQKGDGVPANGCGQSEFVAMRKQAEV